MNISRTLRTGSSLPKDFELFSISAGAVSLNLTRPMQYRLFGKHIPRYPDASNTNDYTVVYRDRMYTFFSDCFPEIRVYSNRTLVFLIGSYPERTKVTLATNHQEVPVCDISSINHAFLLLVEKIRTVRKGT